MKFCTNCGAQLNDDVIFCSACGSNQAAAPQKPEENKNTQIDGLLSGADVSSALIPPAYTAPITIILCILTLLGSLIGIGKGFGLLLKMIFFGGGLAGLGPTTTLLALFMIIINAVTFTGAILMLKKKRSGYRMYMISQSVFVVLTMLSGLLLMASMHGMYVSGFSIMAIFLRFWNFSELAPTFLFMILYTVFVKKQLR